jgi:hypothetical protein
MTFIDTPALTRAEHEKIEQAARFREDFVFLQNRLVIRGNSRRPIESFLSMYSRFRGDRETAACVAEITLIFHEGEAGEGITFLVNEHPYRIQDAELEEYVYAIMFYLVLRHVRSHYVIHAGCVARHGRGIVLSGPSGIGKSTLTTRLVSRGFEYLSDDLAPICRTTGLVEPVPLRVGIRPGPGYADLRTGVGFDVNFRGDRKRRVDIETLTGRVPGGAASPSAVVFLTTSKAAARVLTPKNHDHALKVTTTGDGRRLAGAFREEAGISLLTWEKPNVFSEFLLHVDAPSSFLPRLQQLVEESGEKMVELKYEDLEPPDYSRSPELRRIPAAAGIIKLAKNISNYSISEICHAEYGGVLSRAIADLASCLRDVPFYKLRPGQLDEMADAVESIS